MRSSIVYGFIGVAVLVGIATTMVVEQASFSPKTASARDATAAAVVVTHEYTEQKIPSSKGSGFASRIATSMEASHAIQLVQFEQCATCGQHLEADCGCECRPNAGPVSPIAGETGIPADSVAANCGTGLDARGQFHLVGPIQKQAPGLVKGMLGVNDQVGYRLGREAEFQDSQIVPWEMFAYGEYIGPHRTPHVPEYRVRVNDSLEFVYYQTRKRTANAYRLYVGDTIRISSATDETINQPSLIVLSDGTVSLPLVGQVRAAGKTVAELQAELNELYLQYLNDPSILVQIVEGDTPLRDVIAAVDASFGQGGRIRQATVSPDGTIQLPVVGTVPAVGLTLEEIRREVNARYGERVAGLEVTPVLTNRAPTFVYVLGQVTTPGRYELVGPTTVMQAIALAQGDLQGGNLRNIVVFRRDEQWRLIATRLDLAGAIHGRRPMPSDEIYLRDSDIILVPRKPIQRVSEAVELYLTNTLYSIVPQEVVFDFNQF